MWSLILPFHSDSERLYATLDFLELKRKSYRIAEILLCHNGPRLNPEAEELLLAHARHTGAICLHTETKGLGAGYRLGIKHAGQPYLLLSASDLPFGLSDLDSFYEYQSLFDETPRFAIGSKGQKESVIEGNYLGRRALSYVFWLLRVIFLGRQTPRDSQGTLLIEASLAKELVTRSAYEDYFFSLELISLAQQRGIRIIELPIYYRPGGAASSVLLLRDGWKMAKQLLELSRRMKVLPRVDASVG